MSFTLLHPPGIPCPLRPQKWSLDTKTCNLVTRAVDTCATSVHNVAYGGKDFQ